MTVRRALEKEISTLRDFHMRLVQKARNSGDQLYGMSTLATYEHLIGSYSRILKDLVE